MSRTANEKRPEDLRKEILQYLTRNGIGDLSLRPLAKAVGSSPRVLLYYFGSKEKLIANLLSDMRNEQRAIFEQIEAGGFEQTCRAIWEHMTSPEWEPLFRLFFEVYGLALRSPETYGDFLRTTIEDWLNAMAGQLGQAGFDREEGRAMATLLLAGFRGFMLDYCATADRERLDRAMDLWLHSLNSYVFQGKGG